MPSDLRGTGKIVVVAARDQVTRDALDELITTAGYRTRLCADVSSTRAWLARMRPGLLLIDLALRGGGAPAIVPELARLHRGMPVALLTNLLPLDATRRAHDLGVAGVLNRPLNLTEALALIVALVG